MHPVSLNRAAAVTPSDSAQVSASFSPAAPFARRLYIGGAGSLKVMTNFGDTVTYANVGVGYVYLEVVQVFATGTSATDIVAEY